MFTFTVFTKTQPFGIRKISIAAAPNNPMPKLTYYENGAIHNDDNIVSFIDAFTAIIKENHWEKWGKNRGRIGEAIETLRVKAVSGHQATAVAIMRNLLNYGKKKQPRVRQRKAITEFL